MIWLPIGFTHTLRDQSKLDRRLKQITKLLRFSSVNPKKIQKKFSFERGGKHKKNQAKKILLEEKRLSLGKKMAFSTYPQNLWITLWISFL